MGSYSQSGEQDVLIDIFNRIKPTNRVCVEFGGANGYRQSNTRFFIELGWKGHMWDVNPIGEVKEEHITAENINKIFKKRRVPKKFDLLSIDIDGNDYWVWEALTYKPRVVIVEYNPSVTGSLAIEYDPEHVWDRTNYFGASYEAFIKLGVKKGYDMIACIANNLIFIQNDIIGDPYRDIFNFPTKRISGSGWPLNKQNRKWIQV